ncbi:hypothetical protein CLAIMM_05927 [Cladophialophora immunda]|nr:hypothetical protein CLAIMM_05927 [Cladophialophora immunda]
MKFLTTITAAAAFAMATTASTVNDPAALSASVNTFDLGGRSLKKMDGKCTAKGGCKVPGGLHSAYPCWNSKCNVTAKAGDADDTGKNCTIAPGMDGAWVAKCPTNLLPYEWAWPWVPPKKSSKGSDSGKD